MGEVTIKELDEMLSVLSDIVSDLS
jgi:hypothetical protein